MDKIRSDTLTVLNAVVYLFFPFLDDDYSVETCHMSVNTAFLFWHTFL